MQYFWDWAVKPLIVDRRARHVLEIGASLGGNTDRLQRMPGVSVTVIDPCLDTDLPGKYTQVANVRVCIGRSLEVLQNLDGSYDAILIDGDHNHHTVINELRLIWSRHLLSPGGFILFHDVGAPWARQDLYYEPERIPNEAKLPAAPHGVLSAIEDFRKESSSPWAWMVWRTEHGLGCLVDVRSPTDLRALRLKTFLWRSIRWKNRLLRYAGLRKRDHILWGKQPQA